MSGAKLCAAAFTGPKTRTILSNTNFEIERRSWTSFRLVVNNFLGSNKAANYQQSIKVLFLHSHLHFSPDNLGDVSNKHSERFHRDVAPRSNSITAEWTPLYGWGLLLAPCEGNRLSAQWRNEVFAVLYHYFWPPFLIHLVAFFTFLYECEWCMLVPSLYFLAIQPPIRLCNNRKSLLKVWGREWGLILWNKLGEIV
jgi:hypothetical protein